MKDCNLWTGLHAGAGEEHEKEGAVDTKHYEMTAVPLPCPPAPLRARR